jgi:polyferredoxin
MNQHATSTCTLNINRKHDYKWALGLIMVAVLTLGWRFPLLGFVVPIAMAAGVVGGLFRGRWICGNLCPRGSFLDSWFSLVAAKKDIPALLKNRPLRWTVATALMSFMVYRLAQNPGDINHLGLVFWQMCFITTLIAVFLGIRYSARSWCNVCPVGTMAGSMGGKKYPLQIDSSCKACGLCEDSCPMQLEIARYRHTGNHEEADCIKCSACMQTCPREGVLSWPEKKAA